MSEPQVLNEVVESTAQGNVIGQVKWFNDKLGFGFITINEGPDRGRDIFVHHSGIRPANSNYKTLRKGEYVNFNIVKGLNGLQGTDITGINGGPLMCDIVMGSRKPTDLPVASVLPPPRGNDWQTVQRHQYQPRRKYNRSVPPPPPSASTTA